MANTYADRVQETSTTTGTGTYDLAGPTTGYQGFVAGAGDAATVTYLVTDGTDWEVGTGVVTDAATDTLSRASILSSSNAGSAVNWGAGTKTISLTLPASVFAAHNRPIALISDTKAAGSDAGTFTAGTDVTRTLNTVDYDPDNIVSLSSNQFTLQAGTYRIQARAPVHDVDFHAAWLYNVTDAATPPGGEGSSVYTASPYNGSGDSYIDCVVTIASAKAFEIRHRCTTTKTINGLGAAASITWQQVKFCCVKIKKL